MIVLNVTGELGVRYLYEGSAVKPIIIIDYVDHRSKNPQLSDSYWDDLELREDLKWQLIGAISWEIYAIEPTSK